MAEKDLEATDPYALVAMTYPADPGTDPEEIMARCFIEEFALMGFPPDRILALFRSSHFAGTHSILESRGEEFVAGLIDAAFAGSREEAGSW